MLAGLHRGRSSDPKTTALEPNRSSGSSPPFRLPDRVAGHSPPAGWLALPGRCPPPIPPRRGPTRFGSGIGHRLVLGRLFHPSASSARVGHSGRRPGSCRGRGRLPVAAACQAEAGPVWPLPGAGLRSFQHVARHGRGHPGPATGSAIGRRRRRGIRLNQGLSSLARPQRTRRERRGVTAFCIGFPAAPSVILRPEDGGAQADSGPSPREPSTGARPGPRSATPWAAPTARSRGRPAGSTRRTSRR